MAGKETETNTTTIVPQLKSSKSWENKENTLNNLEALDKVSNQMAKTHLLPNIEIIILTWAYRYFFEWAVFAVFSKSIILYTCAPPLPIPLHINIHY